MATIGKVIVQPTQRTTISSPNFSPRINVSVENIDKVNVSVRSDGDVLVYDATVDEYVSKPLNEATVTITSINGGSF